MCWVELICQADFFLADISGHDGWQKFLSSQDAEAICRLTNRSMWTVHCAPWQIGVNCCSFSVSFLWKPDFEIEQKYWVSLPAVAARIAIFEFFSCLWCWLGDRKGLLLIKMSLQLFIKVSYKICGRIMVTFHQARDYLPAT